ncbi:MAG: ribonuclease Z [Clostridiales bacterium]|nr:ribonuclease Z [Clostridiales bacterium]
MTLIICIDEKGGLSFANRRQSQDRALREYIMSNFVTDKIIMSNYSYKQFSEYTNVIADDDFLINAVKGDVCFIEGYEIPVDRASKIILCNWNRHYPADKFFNTDLAAKGFDKISENRIKGYSHDEITIETYIRSIA